MDGTGVCVGVCVDVGGTGVFVIVGGGSVLVDVGWRGVWVEVGGRGVDEGKDWGVPHVVSNKTNVNPINWGNNLLRFIASSLLKLFNLEMVPVRLCEIVLGRVRYGKRYTHYSGFSQDSATANYKLRSSEFPEQAPHKRFGDNMDYNRVFEIVLGILIALAIGWVLLKYGLGFLYVVVIVMGFIYIVFLILRILRG